MSARFGTGLVVGKFCPLHKGHELLIGRALAACDRVLVISYTKPEFDRCGRAARERWITALYPSVVPLVIDDGSLQEQCRGLGITGRAVPDNDAPDAEHRAFVAWLCQYVLGTTVDAVFTSEGYGDGFAQSLSAHFRAADAGFAGVQHVDVDRARAAVPISGTAIRTDPFGQRHHLSPIVYADLVRRVALLGGESSGKTTLASRLAAHFKTAWVPEYGRQLWEERNGQLRPDDMLAIARKQVEQEASSALHARQWLFCDTTPLTTLFYSQALFSTADPRLEALASRRYDHIVLCAPDFGFVQDGTRQGALFRARQHDWYLHELHARGLSHNNAAGSIEQRLASVAAHLCAVS